MAKPFLLSGIGTQSELALETINNVLTREDRQLLYTALEAAQGKVPRAKSKTDFTALAQGLETIPNNESSEVSPLSQLLWLDWLIAASPELVGRLSGKQRNLMANLTSPAGLLPGCDVAGGRELIERLGSFRKVGIFSTMAVSHLAPLAQPARPCRFAPGEALMTSGEAGSSLFIITQGTVSIHRGDKKIAESGESEVVGEMAVLTPEPRAATVTAMVTVLALELGRAELVGRMREDFELTRH